MLDEIILNTKGLNTTLSEFIVNFFLSIFLSLILEKVFIKYSQTLSNRRSFASNFWLLTTTTMLIICIVKSSLALSLGLVGALSIVRFRTPIKEPEELLYLFLAIAIGLGFGANQSVITILAFIIIVFTIAIRNKRNLKNRKINNMSLVLRGENLQINRIIDLLEPFCDQITLKRFVDNKNDFDLHFGVWVKDFDNFSEIVKAIRIIYPEVEINFIDNTNLIY